MIGERTETLSSAGGLLHLFTPGFERDGDFTPLMPERVLWMLAYLAVHDRWVSRDELTRLLWSDADPETARSNLRQLVYRTRKLGWAPTLEVERSQLRWSDGSDLHRFRRAYRDGRWEEALAFYQGELLSGFESFEAEEFSAWLELERRDLVALWREAAQNQAATLEQSGRFEEAASVLERILRSDPLAEDVLCEYLRLALQSGRRDHALELYRDFAKVLREELSLEPREETRQLFEALRSSAGVPRTLPRKPSEATPQTSRLRLSATRFVGRAAELVWLEDKLQTPGVRVLSLVGPGGIGKTQLALEAARRFPGQAVFVSLVGHDAGQSLAPAVAEELGLTLPGQAEAETELVKVLHGQTLLLVLDNVEQVLEEARRLASCLEALEEVQLLFTSRVRLGLTEEHSLEVSGLNFPEPGKTLTETAESYDAVRLLLETVWRVNPEAKPSSPSDQAEAVRICQSVAGVPLALVLAGAWARLLTLAEIASELEHNLDFLAGAVRGLPERHGGMRAVFEHSWKLLSKPQRKVLAGLSVFRGGFDRTSALAVTGASNLVLLELLDSSLLRRVQGETNRFDLHELVRQYAQEKLEADPQQAATLRQQHAQWFLTWAEQATLRRQKGLELAQWFRRVEQDYDNLRAVLTWAEGEARAETTIRLVWALEPFLRTRGYYGEGRDWLNRALAQLGSLRGTSLHAQALALLGKLSLENQADTVVRAIFQEALEVARTANDPDSLGMALKGLGDIAYYQQNYPLARQYEGEFLELSRRQGDMVNVAAALNNIAVTHRDEGDDEVAFQIHHESLALSREVGDAVGQSLSLLNLGNLATYLSDYPAAKDYYEQSLEIATALGDRNMMLVILNALGGLAFLRADYVAARSFYRQSLQQSQFVKYPSDIAELLEGIAVLLAATSQGRVAAQLLGHAESEREVVQIFIRPNMLSEYQTRVEGVKTLLGEVTFSQAWQEGQAMSLEQALALAQEALDAANLG